MQPFPVTFWSGRRESLVITEDAVLEDAWVKSAISRISVKEWTDALAVTEAVSLPLTIIITEDAVLTDEWEKIAISRVISKMFGDDLTTTEVLDLTKVTHPTGPPESFLAVDTSVCNGGTPSYSVTLSWTNVDARYDVKVYKDSVYVTTLTDGETQYIDTSVTENDAPMYSVTHLFNGDESSTTSYGVGVANPCA